MEGRRPATVARRSYGSYGLRRVGSGTLPLVLGLTLAQASPAGAQGVTRPAPGSAPATRAAIPVVERFDPTTGQRTRWTVAELTTGQLLALQRALARAGYDPAVRDGALDRPTRSALSAFQRARRLPACGCPSYATVVALGLRPQVVETVVGSGRRQPRFAHATTGAAETVASARGAQGPAGSVSVTTEAGVVVIRGSGSGTVADRAGPPAAPGAPASPSAETPLREPSGQAAYETYMEPLYYSRWLFPHLRPGGPHAPGRRHAGERGGEARGAGARPRPPIPYAPRLPDPPPAAPGLPPSLPPHPGSGSGGG